jgi:DNA repair exonuclease SbcCD ATPase subunit
MNNNIEFINYANNMISNLAKNRNIQLPDIPKYLRTVRYNMSMPTKIKMYLMELKKVTGMPMNQLIIRAITEYAQGHGISETELDVITVNRTEYLKLKEENRELKRNIGQLSNIRKELNRKDTKIKELTNLLNELIKENKRLRRNYKKLETQLKNTENKLKTVMKKDPILNLKNYMDEMPENTELPLTKAFKQLGITHKNDKIKFIDKNLKQDNEISTSHLSVFSFMDDRLSDYFLITEGSIFDGKIIHKSNLNNIIARINERIEKQKELEKLRAKMKDCIKPIEKELGIEIKNKHPELYEPIFEYIAKLNRCETPQQLIMLVDEIKKWLKQYNITLSKDVIEEVDSLIKSDEQKRYDYQELLRDSD